MAPAPRNKYPLRVSPLYNCPSPGNIDMKPAVDGSLLVRAFGFLEELVIFFSPSNILSYY